MIVSARLRYRRLRDGDRGFALVFTLMITSVVMIMVTTVMTTVAPGVDGARRSQDTTAALIAARSGVDDAIAYLMSIPSCRSESRICSAALQMGSDVTKQVSTDNLAAAGMPRPALVKNGAAGPFKQYQQSFSWAIDQKLTPEGFVRVRSTGIYKDNVRRTIVADLALHPSILSYGYYTDYESLSPEFVQSYYKPRSIYLDDAATCSNVSTSCSSSSPKYLNWAGPTNQRICGQHYYADGSTLGRAAAGDAPITETGKLNTSPAQGGTSISRSMGCDLNFTASMNQNGKTFTRDAILSAGKGPIFNKPVYTMWGYKDANKNYASPAFNPSTQLYRLAKNATAMTGPYKPAIPSGDLTLPASIGKDGIPDDACVYTGPTRVKLNGDGTATVTSPLTRAPYVDASSKAKSDSGCYPANLAGGVVGWRYDYNSIGGGAIVARKIGVAPSTGWPVNPTRSTQTPGANNEIFSFTATGTDAAKHSDKSGAQYSGCTSTATYSSSLDATCAWTTVGATTEGSASLGWTSYTKTTCGSAAATNRQLFECEYAAQGSTASPAPAQAGGAYKTVRDNVQADLANANCLSGTAAAQATCVNALVQARVNVANSTTTVNGSRRYVATTTVGSASTGTVATGTVAGPTGTTTDTFFTQPTPSSESLTRTPLTTVVKRQVYSSSSASWGSDSTAFTLTTTQSDYTYTAAKGTTYFPNEKDVTAYNTGTDAAGTTTIRGTAQAPQSGDRQPGDLYIDGQNKGKLSVLADDDVIVTGNIKNPSGYTPDSDAVSITAGQDVRNYNPVACADQDTTDVNATAIGWCPNDFTGLTTSTSATAGQYDNLIAAGDRQIDAVIFALAGSFGTDNYNRADAVGNLNVFGGVYQSHRGGNGTFSTASNGTTTTVTGTNLQYSFVDLQRSNLPYVPQATFGDEIRPWNVASISPG